MTSYKSRWLRMVFRDGGVRIRREIAAKGGAKARNETVKLNLKGLGRTFLGGHFGHFWLPGRSVRD